MDRWDILAALGIAFIALGLALVAPWLGLTVGGVLLLAAGVAGGVLDGRVAVAAAARRAVAGSR